MIKRLLNLLFRLHYNSENEHSERFYQYNPYLNEGIPSDRRKLEKQGWKLIISNHVAKPGQTDEQLRKEYIEKGYGDVHVDTAYDWLGRELVAPYIRSIYVKKKSRFIKKLLELEEGS